jgi:hypothetical protein
MSANWVFNRKVCLFTFNCFYGKSVSLSRLLFLCGIIIARAGKRTINTHTQREKGEREREENESSKTLLLFVCKDTTTKAADDDFCGSKKSAGKKKRTERYN